MAEFQTPEASAPPFEIGLEKDYQRKLSVNSAESIKVEGLSSSVEITVSASNLLNRDSISKSDPFCILYIKEDNRADSEWIEVDRTECVKNDLNPEWGKKFILDYKFEERQMLRFMVYDWDGSVSVSLNSHDFLGKFECTLGEIVSSPHGKLSRPLRLPELYKDRVPRNESVLNIVAEELGECRKVLCLKVECKTVVKMSSFIGNTSNSPCLVISKQLDDASWVLVHRTDRFDRTFNLRVASLTSGKNLERPLKFQLFHKKQNSKWANAKLVGEIRTNYLDILQKYQQRSGPFELYNPIRKQKSQGCSTGSIEILSLSVCDQATFLDHISNGLQLTITVGIDFTASNGDPSRHTSLHYKHGGTDNPYVLAIKAVGEIINDYTSDKKFAAFGFGAKGFPEGNRVNHKFPINFKQNDPFCVGIDGVLNAYYRVLKRIKLFGPTYFTPIIQEQVRMVRENEGKYHVLLILTDGIICDPISTRDAIVKAADLPLSLIIIGIGDEDFKEMEKLDCDGSFLKDSNGRLASRDIVQFVELKKYVNFKSINPINKADKAALSRAVLAELPSQVCEWMGLFAK